MGQSKVKDGQKKRNINGPNLHGTSNNDPSTSKNEQELKEKIDTFLATFKTQPCPKETERTYHDHRVRCYYHSAKDRRRNPFQELYDKTETKTIVEEMYHPTKYKTVFCDNQKDCIFGEFCAKAHTKEELVDEEDAIFKFTLKMSMRSSRPKENNLRDFYTDKEARKDFKNVAYHTQDPNLDAWSHATQQAKEFTFERKKTLNKHSVHWFMISESRDFLEHLKNIAFEEGLCQLRVQRNSWAVGRNPVITILGIDADIAMERTMHTLDTPPDGYFTFRRVGYIRDRVRSKLEVTLSNGRLIPKKFIKLFHLEIQQCNVVACVVGNSEASLEAVFGKIDFWIQQERYGKFLTCYCCLEKRNVDEGIKCVCDSFIC